MLYKRIQLIKIKFCFQCSSQEQKFCTLTPYYNSLALHNVCNIFFSIVLNIYWDDNKKIFKALYIISEKLIEILISNRQRRIVKFNNIQYKIYSVGKDCTVNHRLKLRKFVIKRKQSKIYFQRNSFIDFLQQK